MAFPLLRVSRNSKCRGQFHKRLWIVFALCWACAVTVDICDTLHYRKQCEEWWAKWRVIRGQEEQIFAPIHKLQQGTFVTLNLRRHPLVTVPKNSSFWTKCAYLIEDTLAEHIRRVPKQKVDSLLNQGKPLPTRKPTASESQFFEDPTKGEVAFYTDPAHGLIFRLYFQDGYFTGQHLIRPVLAAPKRAAWWTAFKQSGFELVPYTWYAWIVVLLLMPFLKSHRHLGAEVLLMVGIVALLATLPSPLSMDKWLSLHKNPRLPWCITMICASLAVLAWVHYSIQSRSRIRCPVCDYNLAGNVSGICSECGSKIPDEIRSRLAAALPCS